MGAREIVADAYGHEGLELRRVAGRFGVRACCGQCGAHEERFFSTAKPFPPERARVLMQERGWESRGARWVCPTCVEKNRKARREKLMAEKVVPHPSAAPPRQPSVEDRRIIRAKLEEVYDTGKGFYSGDLSDAKVAGDLGVPVAWVAGVREIYGDDRCEARPMTREELAAALMDLRSAKTGLDEVRAKVDALAAKVAPQLARVTQAYDQVTRK